jgi:hypothetical protein
MIQMLFIAMTLPHKDSPPLLRRLERGRRVRAYGSTISVPCIPSPVALL